MVAAAPAFREAPLPDACPPPDAAQPTSRLLVRLVRTDPPTAEDFRSCHLEGKTPSRKDHDPCAWQGCSFFAEETPREKIDGIAKYKNHADKKFLAFIRIDEQSGVIKIGPDGHHTTVWLYAAFVPENSAEKVVQL